MDRVNTRVSVVGIQYSTRHRRRCALEWVHFSFMPLSCLGNYGNASELVKTKKSNNWGAGEMSFAFHFCFIIFYVGKIGRLGTHVLCGPN